jgi:hypothetical protein
MLSLIRTVGRGEILLFGSFGLSRLFGFSVKPNRPGLSQTGPYSAPSGI